VFLMTSRADPFPCVCQEAMACGLPILAFEDGGGTVEMIGDQAGFAIPHFDVSSMADRLLELASDPALRSKFGQRGAAMVREKWHPGGYRDFLLTSSAG
jgi:glycosyltransferase involved in cell wall biosynthesis